MRNFLRNWACTVYSRILGSDEDKEGGLLLVGGLDDGDGDGLEADFAHYDSNVCDLRIIRQIQEVLIHEVSGSETVGVDASDGGQEGEVLNLQQRIIHGQGQGIADSVGSESAHEEGDHVAGLSDDLEDYHGDGDRAGDSAAQGGSPYDSVDAFVYLEISDKHSYI